MRAALTALALLGAGVALYLLLVTEQHSGESGTSATAEAKPVPTSRQGPVAGTSGVAAPALPGVLPFERPASYEQFDFRAVLARSLEDAALGDPASQFRASVMLRDCRDASRSVQQIDSLRTGGVPEGHIALIRERSARCAGTDSAMGRDSTIASRRWAELALQQEFPIAVASAMLSEGGPPPAGDIDETLRAALRISGNDRVLRYQTYFLVLAAMDKRAAVTGMEPDHTVRTAWTLLHCRESWECDLNATVDSLLLETTHSSLNASIELATQTQIAIDGGNLEGVRIH